jgi:hypothetical protein
VAGGTTATPYGSKQIWQLGAAFAAASSTFAAASAMAVCGRKHEGDSHGDSRIDQV